MSYEWIDYQVNQIDVVMAEAEPNTKARVAVLALFVNAARRGWDIAHAALYMARRVEHWNMTIRLALTPPPDVVETWIARGWDARPVTDAERAQIIALLPESSRGQP